MRRTVTFFSLLLFALLVQKTAQAQGPTAPVRRLANVKSIYVDRASFKITWTSCGRNINGILFPCADANAKRDAFLNALERWLGKYGVTVAPSKDSADAILRGTIHMDDNIAAKTRDYHKAQKRRGKDEIVSLENYQEEWSIAAWLENSIGDEIWRNGRWYPKPSHGFSSIGKVKGKELAKEIEHNLK